MNDSLFTSQPENTQTLQGTPMEWFGLPYIIPTPVPYTTFINDLRNTDYKLSTVLPVLVQEESPECFVVSAEDLEVYEQGVSKYEALDNLKRAIIDLYNFYKNNASDLEGNELRIWEHLRGIIQND